jgi:hypothetical protein
MLTNQVSNIKFIYFIVISFVSLILYFKGFNGPYFFDDYLNFINLKVYNDNSGFNKFLFYVLSGDAGPLKRPISTLSFLIHASNWPTSPYLFKLFNFVFHLLNGLLLYVVNVKILRILKLVDKKQIHKLAILATLLWLWHPFLVSTVLYSVQRMTILPVMFVLLGFLIYINGRIIQKVNYNRGLKYLYFAIYLFTSLAVLSKENGILLPFLLFIFESIILNKNDFKKLKPIDLTFLFYIPISVILVSFIITFPEMLIHYQNKEFLLIERLLSESRALVTYLYHLFIPSYLTEGIYTDGFTKSTSLWNPITTLLSVVTILLIIFISIKQKKKYPIACFSFLFFFLAHLTESTIWPLELYYEHRNYLPALFLPLFVVFGVSKTIKNKRIFLIVFLSCITFLAVNTYLRTKLWSNNLELHRVTAYKYPNSIRAQTMLGVTLGNENKKLEAMKSFKYSLSLHDNIELNANYLNIKCLIDKINDSEVNEFINKLKFVKFVVNDTAPFANLINTIVMNKCVKLKPKTALEFIKIIEMYNDGFNTFKVRKVLLYNKMLALISINENEQAIEILNMLMESRYNSLTRLELYKTINSFLDKKEYKLAKLTLNYLEKITLKKKYDIYHDKNKILQYTNIINHFLRDFK